MEELDFYVVEPSEKPKAVIQILHGMQEYKERYIPFMNYLAAHGYVVVIHDQRGHGKNAKIKGYLGEGDGWFNLVCDADQIQTMMHEKYPDCRYVLLGHSMGSMVARSYFKRYQAKIDALILVGAPNYNALSPFACALSKLVILFRGSKHPSKLLANLFFKDANKVYPELSWISLDQDNVAAYKADPLCGIPFTASAFYYLARGVMDMHDYKGIKPYNCKTPILFVVGEDDPIVGALAGLNDSIDVFKQVGFEDVTSLSYLKMRHEILNESIKEIVYGDIGDWLEKHVNH